MYKYVVSLLSNYDFSFVVVAASISSDESVDERAAIGQSLYPRLGDRWSHNTWFSTSQ